MVSKDQAIGGAILLVCILVAAFYIAATFAPNWIIELFKLKTFELNFRIWAITIPVFIAFIAILFIGAWIGWTMATTPPPKPIEEITTEIEDNKEEASEKVIKESK
jgi:formate hydrogenlyase subunit 3/multisubunit Na+/H+ antiporter MnhD subunit